MNAQKSELSVLENLSGQNAPALARLRAISATLHALNKDSLANEIDSIERELAELDRKMESSRKHLEKCLRQESKA